MNREAFYGVIAFVVMTFSVIGFLHTIEQWWKIIRGFRRARLLEKELESIYRGGSIIERYRDYKKIGVTFSICPNGCCVVPDNIFHETVKFKDPKGKVRTARRVIAESNPEYDGPRSSS